MSTNELARERTALAWVRTAMSVSLLGWLINHYELIVFALILMSLRVIYLILKK